MTSQTVPGPGVVDRLARRLPALLLPWYQRHQRLLPWRQTTDPYAIWLSETMLQQTQVATATPFYHRFLERFPTVQALASADLQEVLRYWAGLGYYRRARHLHLAAQAVVKQHGGQLPPTADQLVELPGVGRYTAGAVATFAFNQRTPIVDCNVARVLCRLCNWAVEPSAPAASKALWLVAQKLVPREQPGMFNHAVMELGATLCTARDPQCGRCPAQSVCGALAAGTTGLVPLRRVKKATPVLRRYAFVLRAHGRVLLLQRPRKCIWEELWEFPCLKKPRQLNVPSVVADLVLEQLGLPVRLESGRASLTHQLTHRTLRYTIYRGEVLGGVEQCRLPACEGATYRDWRWVDDLAVVPVATVNTKIAALAGLG